MVKYHLTFEFNSQSGDTVTGTAIAETRQEGYSQARQSLIDNGIVRDISEFESEFTTRTTRYRYHNPPWNNGQELIETLRAMDSVSTVRYSDTYDGAYGPPTWYVRANNESSLEDVAEEVESFFNGFDIEIQASTVAVSTKPPKDISSFNGSCVYKAT